MAGPKLADLRAAEVDEANACGGRFLMSAFDPLQTLAQPHRPHALTTIFVILVNNFPLMGGQPSE